MFEVLFFFQAEDGIRDVAVTGVQTCALPISGGTWGMVVGHVAPEAYVGGTIALVKEGDSITIDAKKRLLQLNVPAKELAARRKKWQPPKPRYTRGLLAKYMKLVSTASEGAVTDTG